MNASSDSSWKMRGKSPASPASSSSPTTSISDGGTHANLSQDAADVHRRARRGVTYVQVLRSPCGSPRRSSAPCRCLEPAEDRVELLRANADRAGVLGDGERGIRLDAGDQLALALPHPRGAWSASRPAPSLRPARRGPPWPRPASAPRRLPPRRPARRFAAPEFTYVFDRVGHSHSDGLRGFTYSTLFLERTHWAAERYASTQIHLAHRAAKGEDALDDPPRRARRRRTGRTAPGSARSAPRTRSWIASRSRERLDHLVAGRAQRARRDLVEVEVEAANLVAVFGEVVEEEDDRLAGDGEVEHRRRVVGDQDVGGQVQVADVGIRGDVAAAIAERAERAPIRWWGRRRSRWPSPSSAASRSTSSCSAKPSVAALVDEVVAPGRGVEDHRLALGRAERRADPRPNSPRCGELRRRCADSRSRGSRPRSGRRGGRSRC